MRDIIFQEVGMENFGPYIEPMIHTFTNDTLTMIVGPNGIGKTMSIEALPYTLYGVTSKGVRGEDLINNSVGKNCKTWVKFLINENKYLVTRYQKYSKFGTTVILNVNGVDTKSGHREVVPEIERLVCSQKTFMNTLFFGQKTKDFFTDLVDSDKKEIFRKILGLEQYTEFYKETDKRLKELNNEISELQTNKKVKIEILNDIIKQIEYLTQLEKKFYEDQKIKLVEIDKSLSENERLLNSWNETLEELKTKDYDIDSIKDSLLKINNKLEGFSANHNLILNDLKVQAEQKKYELKETAREADDKIVTKTLKQTQEIDEQIQNLKQTLIEIVQDGQDKRHEISQKVLALEMENNSHNSRIIEIKENVLEKDISSCPTCEQDVDEQTRDKLLDQVSNHEKEIKIKTEKIKMLDTTRKSIIHEVSDKSDEIHKEIESLQIKRKSIEDNAVTERRDISQRLNITFSKVDELTSQRENELGEKSKIENKELIKLKQETEILLQESQKHEKELSNTKNTINNINNEISVLKTQRKHIEEETFNGDQLLKYKQREMDVKYQLETIDSELNKHSKKLEILQFWKTGFSSSGIPSMLIDESIPFMNKTIYEYLDLLTNGRYIVSFDTLDETKGGKFRDKISVRVLDTHTKANSRNQLSGGQTRIIDIATILTLGDLQSNIHDTKINILLFDEIFDSLDEENIGYVAKVLNKLKVGKSILIISHQHQDQVEADQTLALA